MVSRKIYHFISCASFLSLATGCTSPAPLDDAQLGEITVASSEDRARFLEAHKRHARETFGSVTFSRGSNQEPITFGPEDYDEYLAYLKDHRGTGLTPTGQVQLGPTWYDWPIMRLTFRSKHQLFDESDLSPSVDFYLCDKKAEDWEIIGIWYPRIMWKNKIVFPPVSKEITKTLKTGSTPQEYEVFFAYVYWDYEGYNSGKVQRMLLPLPSDLCVSLFNWNYPFGPNVGRPLRISKDFVNEAVGDLPRPIPAP